MTGVHSLRELLTFPSGHHDLCIQIYSVNHWVELLKIIIISPFALISSRITWRTRSPLLTRFSLLWCAMKDTSPLLNVICPFFFSFFFILSATFFCFLLPVRVQVLMHVGMWRWTGSALAIRSGESSCRSRCISVWWASQVLSLRSISPTI